MILTMLTLVMIQMQSFRMMFIVIAVAPLGMIGVVAALQLSSRAPLGFVAILGVLALVGILIRNSVILMHEVAHLLEQGRSRWDAVFEASDSRARPIILTAAAAGALIPISRQVFWGPMAFAMMGGIIAGTLITLVFAPALYCLVYRVKPPVQPPAEPEVEPEAAPERASRVIKSPCEAGRSLVPLRARRCAHV